MLHTSTCFLKNPHHLTAFGFACVNYRHRETPATSVKSYRKEKYKYSMSVIPIASSPIMHREELSQVASLARTQCCTQGAKNHNVVHKERRTTMLHTRSEEPQCRTQGAKNQNAAHKERRTTMLHTRSEEPKCCTQAETSHSMHCTNLKSGFDL